MRKLRSRTRLQAGVGLIEVLVAVVVLSIAFLGVAALQAMSLSTNNSAMARSMATIASYSILDAMRADMTGAEAGNYTSASATANACPATGTGLAAAQITQWCNQLKATLGDSSSTQGNIMCNTVTGTGSDKTVNCTITITFDDSRAGTGGSNLQKVTTRAML